MNYLACIFAVFLIAVCVGVGNTQITPAPAKTKSQDAKCLLPLEPGPCRMSLERYYYNSNTNTCEKFKFGGCRGNDNKFGFRQTCEEACVITPPAKTSIK